MRKGKVGLQKQISRIFTGVQIPKKDAARAASAPAPAPTSTPASTPVLTPAPAPVKTPARPVPPKPASPPPRPFVTPEPATSAAPAAQPKVYEPAAPPVGDAAHKTDVPQQPAVKSKLYEPPPVRQKVYEPPPIPTPPVQETKIEQGPSQHGESPLLKAWERISAKLLAPKPGASPGRQKVMILLMPVLAVVFVVVIFGVLRKPAVKSSSKPNSKSSQSAQTVFDGKIDWVLPSIYPDNLRDPMVFGAVTTQGTDEDLGRPAVKGIVFSEDKPCAVVGDRVVFVGEVVQGATVVKINPDSVEFQMGDKKWTQEVEH
jgi:hypothetical protein